MATTINPSNITNITEYPNSFKRQGAFPLERYSIFTSLEGEGGAREYASSNPIAYVGQNLVVVENGTVAAYIIASESGDLVRLAATTESGDLSADIIALQNRVGSLETKVTALETKTNELAAADTALGERLDTVESELEDANTAIAANTTKIGTIESEVNTLKSDSSSKVGTISGGDGVVIGGTATEPVVQLKVDPVEGNALTVSEDGLKVTVPAATDYTVEVSTEETTEGAAKSYKFTQAATGLDVTIDIPKDMVVSSGAIVVNPEGQSEGTYIELTLANTTEDKLYINVTDLLDDKAVSGGDSATIKVTVDSSTGVNVVTAAVVDGAIGTIQLADLSVTTAKIDAGAVTTAKIADNAVEKAKLSTDIQASLGLADTALQAADIDLASGDANGTVKLTVDGTSKDVAVTGLGAAAYKGIATTISADITDVATANIVADYVSDAIAVRRYE